MPRWDGDHQRGVLFIIVIALLLSTKSNKLCNLATRPLISGTQKQPLQVETGEHGRQCMVYSQTRGVVVTGQWMASFPSCSVRWKLQQWHFNLVCLEMFASSFKKHWLSWEPPWIFLSRFFRPSQSGWCAEGTAGFTAGTSPLLLAQAHTSTSHHHQSGHPGLKTGDENATNVSICRLYQKRHQKLS